MEHYDLFGQINEPKEPEKPSRKFKTMQDLHGLKEGQTCKTCIFLVRHQWDKVYYKCSLWHLSHSAATDIRVKNPACGKWEGSG